MGQHITKQYQKSLANDSILGRKSGQKDAWKNKQFSNKTNIDGEHI
jgi:hypothetical protein